MDNQENRRMQQGNRPAGRPQGAPQGRPMQGARPQGAPQGRPVQGVRPQGAAQGRPVQGSRPQGTAQGRPVQGTRPQGVAQGRPVQGSRPQGAAQGRPVQGTRPQGAAQGRPVQGTRPQGAAQGRPVQGTRSQRTSQTGRPATRVNAQGRPQGTRGNGGGNGRPPKGPVNGGRGKQQPPKKKGKGKTLAIIAVEFVVFAVLLVAAYFVIKGTDKETGVTKYDIDEENIVINEQVAENETLTGYRTIALFGVDNTKDYVQMNSEHKKDTLGKGNRTDTIMICSINQETGEIRLVSVYRDTYLNLSNDTYNKANNAYAKGGPEMAINMLNQNLDLNITEYVTVGFGGLVNAIDNLGGVEIEVTDSEVDHLNNYQISICGTENGKNAAGETAYVATEGKDYIKVTNGGVQKLNGLQAAGYCRIRYAKNCFGNTNDWGRTERQRTVLTKMLEGAKQANIAKLSKLATDEMQYVATNMDINDIISLLGNVTKYNVVGNDGFPYEEYRGTANMGSKGSCVLPLDLEKNVIWLHEFLYDETDYVPSAEVKAYSEKISADISKVRID